MPSLRRTDLTSNGTSLRNKWNFISRRKLLMAKEIPEFESLSVVSIREVPSTESQRAGILIGSHASSGVTHPSPKP